MHVEIVLNKQDLDFFAKAKLDKETEKNIKKLPPRDDWRNWDNENFLEFMVECICTTQQKYDSKSFQVFLASEVYEKALWREPEDIIEKVLRRYSVRFPKRKAQQIASK